MCVGPSIRNNALSFVLRFGESIFRHVQALSLAPSDHQPPKCHVGDAPKSGQAEVEKNALNPEARSIGHSETERRLFLIWSRIRIRGDCLADLTVRNFRWEIPQVASFSLGEFAMRNPQARLYGTNPWQERRCRCRRASPCSAAWNSPEVREAPEEQSILQSRSR